MVDVVGFIEAAYALDEPEGPWLAGIARAAARAFDVDNLGAYAITYDASDVRDFRVTRLETSRALDARTERVLRDDFPRIYASDPALVRAVFRRTPFGSSRALPPTEGMRDAHAKLTEINVDSILGLNGVTPDGRSVHAGVLLPRPAAVSPELLSRLSSHLSAGARLRKRMATTAAASADAVLAAGGRVLHAERGAKLLDARARLSDAAAAIRRARGPLRRNDPGRAVATWRALVSAQWSLVDHFERDGKHYLVAYRNEPAIGVIPELSDRERQVVALAAMGYANKMIGYELGIAASTVGVLIGRAAKRLGVRSRAELVALYERDIDRFGKPRRRGSREGR